MWTSHGQFHGHNHRMSESLIAAYGDFEGEIDFDSRQWVRSYTGSWWQSGDRAEFVLVKSNSLSKSSLLSPRTLIYGIFHREFGFDSQEGSAPEAGQGDAPATPSPRGLSSRHTPQAGLLARASSGRSPSQSSSTRASHCEIHGHKRRV